MNSRRLIFLVCVSSFASALGAAAATEGLKIEKLSFLATTNVKMFKFGGEAKDVQAKLERKGNDLASLEIRVPIANLKTGMDIRDKHMRERIFTAADGSTPDIVFASKQCICGPTATEGEKACTADGILSFRGQSHPYKLPLTLKGGSKIEGHALIDVIGFGVDPKQLAWANIVVDKFAAIDFEAAIQ